MITLPPHTNNALRYEPDSPVKGPVRDLPHMAFRVSNLKGKPSETARSSSAPSEAAPGAECRLPS